MKLLQRYETEYTLFTLDHVHLVLLSIILMDSTDTIFLV